MTCPECGRAFSRREFGRDERYFECDECNIALELSPDEQLDEYERHGTIAHDEPVISEAVPNNDRIDEGRVASTVEETDSIWPPRVWVGLLVLFVALGIASGIQELTAGAYVEAAFTICFMFLFICTIVGVVLRRRFGLYLTFALMILFLLSSVLTLMTESFRSFSEFLGAVFGCILFLATEIWIFKWFHRNAHLFVPRRTEPALIEDVYTSSTSHR